MKYSNFVLAIVLFITTGFSNGCGDPCKGVVIKPDHDIRYHIEFSYPVDYQLNNNGKELDVTLEIISDFAENACLIVYAGKAFLSENPLPGSKFRYEGFKDSLNIDGFHIRSYSIYDANDLSSPVDFPVYVKNVFVNEGKSAESFKIVFPDSFEIILQGNWVSGLNTEHVFVYVGIVRFNDEIKSKFNFNTYSHINNPNNDFFKFFPDSSSTSFVFSNSGFFESLTTTRVTEKISGECIDFKHVSYLSSYFSRLFLKYKK